jgi:hypothetical protein
MGEMTNAYNISNSRWEDNIITDLREIGWRGVDMHVA